MPKLECNCGYSVENKDRYNVEAQMWHHAISDHQDMLTQMSVEQLEGWLKDKDMKLTAV